MLFPDGVVVRECRDGEHPELALPEEEIVVAKGVEKRKREFRAGRAAARLALRELGIPDSPILANDDRSPRWPEGVVGSISHKGGYAIAAVGPRESFVGIGVDTEPAVSIEERLWRRILTEDEIAALPHGDEGQRALLLFCAKESFHKCVHPPFGVFFEYREASFRLDDDRQTFSVEVRREVPEGFPPNDRLHGRWQIEEGRILTAMVLME